MRQGGSGREVRTRAIARDRDRPCSSAHWTASAASSAPAESGAPGRGGSPRQALGTGRKSQHAADGVVAIQIAADETPAVK